MWCSSRAHSGASDRAKVSERKTGASAGFTLIETVVALSLLGLAMLLGLGILLQEPRISARLDAREAAYRALEVGLESLRSGQLPLRSGTFSAVDLAFEPDPALAQIDIELVVGETAHEGLYEVLLEARYELDGEARSHRLRSMAWRP